ncbi:hypothetical protein MBLNU457_5737t1 [Dothideomycetes sp. NU457]
MAQVLPSKEQSLFRHVVQNYETKQYKKGLKAADQVLKKFPNHGDTQAMKALILNSQGKTDEAFDLAKIALKNAMKSHVCWHVYGLLYRHVKNYEEAIKAYKFALRLDPDSQQIQRDLAMLQVQMRDYQGFIQSRKAMLQARPNFRQHWTALAIAHHLAGEHFAAEQILTSYEDTLKSPPSKSDLEHAGATLYKNTIIGESGDYERALEHLNTIYKNHPDRVAVMELEAQYLQKLGKKQEAEAAYRALLKRNAERRDYYNGLEEVLGLDRKDPASKDGLLELYASYAAKSERIDAPRRVPLDFLEGDDFRQSADKYLRRMLGKNVPSTFANVKALYSNSEKKQIIQELVHSYESEDGPEKGEAGHSNGDTSNQWKISVYYFLAQHYNYYLSRDLPKALEYIDKAIEMNTKKTEYSYLMTKARIFKHQGDTEKAAQLMNQAREMDKADRYINTKCAKYQLRNNEHETATNTMGLFTRKEAVGGPLGDLLDMQCMWFLWEDGESYLRENELGLALKRFKSIHDIFDVWTEDQFDFHTFSLRKGQITAYIDMIRWEDRLREHPFYSRAALSAVKIYTMLADKPSLANESETNGDSAERKKAAKKARKDAEKAEADRKLAAAAKPNAEGEVKKEDPDPNGVELLKTKDPLGEAMKYLTPLLEQSPNDIRAQLAGFEVYIRRQKYLPALRCLIAASKLDAQDSTLTEQITRFKQTLEKLPEPLPPKVDEVIKASMSQLP